MGYHLVKNKNLLKNSGHKLYVWLELQKLIDLGKFQMRLSFFRLHPEKKIKHYFYLKMVVNYFYLKMVVQPFKLMNK